ncbi:MAG: YCF48-related protein [Bacteroidota bacterium]
MFTNEYGNNLGSEASGNSAIKKSFGARYKICNTVLTVTIMVVLLLPLQIYAQGSWQVQNPLPTESYLLTVEPVTDNIIFAGGLGGTLLKTTDAGKTWTVRKFKDLIDIRAISFKDSLNGWLIDSRHIYNTINGGESWNEVYVNVDMSTYFFLDIVCFSNTIYLFLEPQTVKIWELPNAKSLILKSIDNGKTWLQLDQEIKGKMLCAFFLNVGVGFMSTDETVSISEGYTYFYKTSDSGKTWDKSKFIEYPGAVPGIFFLNESLGFVGKYKTTDGGTTWENMFTNYLPQSENVDDIYFTDSLHGWSVSGTKILQTIDGGFSWTEINQHSSHRLTDINFSKNGTGWIVGWAGNIFKKKADTNFWEQLSEGVRNGLFDVSFIDEKEGWCVGTFGCILHTLNGGKTWEEQISNTDSTLFKVKFLNNLEGWIAGYYVVLHTTDGGNNWEVRNDLYWWFVDVDFFDEKNGLLIERFGAVLRTSDGGTSWQPATSQPLSGRLTSIAIVNENEAWIGGWQGLGHTTDKGATIQWHDVPNLLMVEDIQFVDNNTGFLCNDYGSFLGTNDGGWTWRELPRGEGLNDMVSTFFTLDKDTTWIYFGILSGYLKQVTSHQTLEITNIPEYWIHPINSIFFINSNKGWAVGAGGTILSYTGTGLPPSEVQRKQVDIFPNPFDETGTNISFSLKQTQKVSIQIYNSIGQKIQAFYDGLLNEGDKKLFWKPNAIASGVYFISVQCSEFKRAQKCVFIHH